MEAEPGCGIARTGGGGPRTWEGGGAGDRRPFADSKIASRVHHVTATRGSVCYRFVLSQIVFTVGPC